MIDFKIKKGLSTDLYIKPGTINPRLIIEEGCWYLCTDTAELFLGVYAKDENGQEFLTLKQINGNHEGGSAEVDLSEYAKLTDIPDVSEFITNAEVMALIPNVPVRVSELENDAGYITAEDIPETDLSNYYNKEEVDGLINSIEHPTVDLTDYATKEDVIEAVNGIEIPDVSEFIKEIPAEYVTEAELEAKGYLTEHQDISGKADKEHTHSEYALKTDIPDVSNFITSIPTEYLTETELSARGYLTHKDLEGLAQSKDVLDLTAEVATVGAKVAVLENNADNYLTAVPAEYITESELNARGYLQHQALAGYATESFVDAKIEALPQPDLSEYAKKADIPSVNGLATEEFVISEIAKAELSGGEVSEEELNQLLVNYYTKTESYNKSEVDAKIGSIQIPSIEGLATESYVDEAINNIDFPETDLTGYAKLTDIPVVSEFIKDIPAEYVTEEELTAKGYLTEHQDLSHLAEKDHVHEGYAAKEHTHDQYLTEHQDISGKADKEHSHSYNDLTDKPELFNGDYNSLVNKPEIPVVPTNVSAFANDAGYLTQHQDLSHLVTKEELPSLDTYYTKSEVDELIPDVSGFIKEIPSEYITESELATELAKIEIPEAYDDSEIRELINSKAASDHSHDEYALTEHTHDEYLTEHQSLAEYAKKSELFSKDYNDLTNKPTIPSLEGYATEAFVDERYYDKAEVNTFIAGVETFQTNVTTNYATKQYVTESIETAIETHEGIAKKADVEEVKTTLENEVLPIVPTVQELVETAATQEWVNEQGFLTEHQSLEEYAKKIDIPEAEIYKVDFNAPDYAKAVEAYNNGKVLVLINAAPDINSYAVMNYVSEKYITFTKFLTSRSEAYGSFNTYYLSPANTWEISKEVRLNKVEANVDGEVNGELTNIRIGKEVYSLPNIDGLASTEYVDNAIANIPETDLSDYYNKAEVDNIINGIEIPSIEGLATEEFVQQEIAKIDIPEVDLSGLVTNETFERELALKADEVPFTTDKFVTNAIGGFSLNESIKGLTVAEIFAKLLGLVDALPEDPEVPTEPDGIIETIITKQIPMYEIDEACNAVEMPYMYTTFGKDSSDDIEEPTQTSFYQKTENGSIIESGYQHVSSENDSMYYIIALPKELDFGTNVTVLAYDQMDASDPWKPADLTMTSDPAFIAQAFADADLSVPEINTGTHKLWIDETLTTYDGSIYRFIINE